MASINRRVQCLISASMHALYSALLTSISVGRTIVMGHLVDENGSQYTHRLEADSFSNVDIVANRRYCVSRRAKQAGHYPNVVTFGWTRTVACYSIVKPLFALSSIYHGICND